MHSTPTAITLKVFSGGKKILFKKREVEKAANVIILACYGRINLQHKIRKYVRAIYTLFFFTVMVLNLCRGTKSDLIGIVNLPLEEADIFGMMVRKRISENVDHLRVSRVVAVLVFFFVAVEKISTAM